MTSLQPAECISVKENQRRSRFAATKRKPSGSQSHLQRPVTIAGSTNSISGARREGDLSASCCSARIRKRTPRRSMMTDSPRSAVSRRSENCCLALAAVKRFTLYNVQFLQSPRKPFHSSRVGNDKGARRPTPRPQTAGPPIPLRRADAKRFPFLSLRLVQLLRSSSLLSRLSRFRE